MWTPTTSFLFSGRHIFPLFLMDKMGILLYGRDYHGMV
ncbi:hypothetical protein TPY_3090 [Sulfobacillus acidophilus TPY]|nr:hypothetical protein TPY_3090 [Sulfobacillus acidophilus TPY]